MQSYKELLVWQGAMDLASATYRTTRLFPKEEMYGLISQLRRSAVSVPSNIAEGQGRATTGEFLQFLGHARGSLFELETQFILANDLGYIETADQTMITQKITRVAQLLNGLISSLRPSQTTIHEPRST